MISSSHSVKKDITVDCKKLGIKKQKKTTSSVSVEWGTLLAATFKVCLNETKIANFKVRASLFLRIISVLHNAVDVSVMLRLRVGQIVTNCVPN